MNHRSNLSRLLRVLWPVRRDELSSFIPTICLFFLIAVIYNLLRPLKISLVISAPQSGAEIVPYLKVWGVLPAALLFTYFFTILNRRFAREQVFYIMTGIFILFFGIFMTILFPYRENCELNFIADTLTNLLPSGFLGLIAMIRYWHFTLFYLFSELWGSVILSMLFWGFVNETTPLDQAKRFYGMFALGGNLASVAAGQIGLTLSQTNLVQSFPFGQTKWDQSVYSIMCVAIVSSVLIIFIFYYLNHKNHHKTLSSPHSALKKEPSPTFTLKECFVEMVHNPYLRYLALIVLGYNLVFNLTDVLWTNQLRLHFASQSSELNAYMSKITLIKGILATLIAIFISGHTLRHLGWRFTALITPMILVVTSVLFFPLILGQQTWIADTFVTLFNCPILALTVLIGAIQNCMTRASKYTVFDATKEIAFIPLDKKEQRKGKAVIDGVGSRIGKSGGSVTFQFLLLFCSSLTATVPYVAVIVALVCGVWIFSIYRLNELMKNEITAKEKITAQNVSNTLHNAAT